MMLSALLAAAVTYGACVGAPILLTYGDSKTVMRKVGNTDDNEDDWQVVFRRQAGCSVSFNIGTVDGEGWIGQNGITVGQRQDVIDANLAVMSDGHPPAYVLINLGTNDLTAMLQAEADWKADYLYILDAMHAKWPTAVIYCETPWKRNYGAQADTLAGWLAAVIAARPTFVRAGSDERVWLQGADDGATMTNDGIHYSRIGAAEHVRQWRAVLGL